MPAPVLLGEGVLTVDDTTPATLNVLLSPKSVKGPFWIKVESQAVTAGMTSVAVKWQPMGFKYGVAWGGASNLSTTGSATTIASAQDLSTDNVLKQYSLSVDAALQGSVENAIHYDGIQISLTGSSVSPANDATVWVAVYSWGQ